jgi:hypothetical protein
MDSLYSSAGSWFYGLMLSLPPLNRGGFVQYRMAVDDALMGRKGPQQLKHEILTKLTRGGILNARYHSLQGY